MKLVTNDYGCGTSSSILDYEIDDVVIVSENNFNHVFDIEDDLLFIGHDFLFYLWNNEEKLKRWISRKDKFEHWVWCFERVEAIVPIWKQKSYESLTSASKFCKRILACDEDDCDVHGFDWLPQWASKKFYLMRETKPVFNNVLFSGQSGKIEYGPRTQLLLDIQKDVDLKDLFKVTNTSRTLVWDEYINNFLNYSVVLNPIGTLKSLNTRAYEAIYSGRILLQQTIGDYKRHQDMLKNNKNIIFFNNFDSLKSNIEKIKFEISDNDYKNHSLYARMKSIGIDIK